MYKLSFREVSIILHIVNGTIGSLQNKFINSTNLRKQYSDDLLNLKKEGIIYLNESKDLDNASCYNLVVNSGHESIKKLYDNYKYTKR